jgi:hypothetical protein
MNQRLISDSRKSLFPKEAMMSSMKWRLQGAKRIEFSSISKGERPPRKIETLWKVEKRRIRSH